MYKENKYKKWYYSIISKAQIRQLPLSEYKERHHIIPKSLGGNNLPENLVNLTAKEHFVCHLLLTKMVDSQYRSKMLYALWSMTIKENPNQKNKRYKPSSRMYAQIRHIISIENGGANHPQAKTYEVTAPTGTKCIVKYLKQFCEEKNFNYDQVLRLVREHRAGQGGKLNGWSFIDINSTNFQKPLNKPKIYYGNRKTYYVTSPAGEKFKVVGRLQQFCDEHNLVLCSMQTILKTGQVARWGKCIGWSITT